MPKLLLLHSLLASPLVSSNLWLPELLAERDVLVLRTAATPRCGVVDLAFLLVSVETLEKTPSHSLCHVLYVTIMLLSSFQKSALRIQSLMSMISLKLT